jgi:stage III sporulation protein AE
MQSLVNEQIAELNIEPIEKAWQTLRSQYESYLMPGDHGSLIEWLLPAEGQSFQLLELLGRLVQYFFHEIMLNGQLLTTLVVLALFAALLDRLQSSLSNPQVAKLGTMLMLMVLMSIAVHSLYVALDYARDAVTLMSDFMMAMFPMFVALLAASGQFMSMMMIEPVLMVMTQFMSALIQYLVFPLCFFAALLHMASALSEHYKVTRLAELMSTIALSVLGIMITVFLGILSIKGAFMTTADGLSLRAAKFMAGNFVPVVGRMFADAADTVLSASLVVKNAVGFAGLLIVFLLCAFPALKILVLAIMYRLCAAFLQPLGDSPLVVCLEAVGKCLTYVFGAVAALGLMFFLSLTILIGFGNLTLMLR